MLACVIYRSPALGFALGFLLVIPGSLMIMKAAFLGGVGLEPVRSASLAYETLLRGKDSASSCLNIWHRDSKSQECFFLLRDSHSQGENPASEALARTC
jgi:hypothetical protein